MDRISGLPNEIICHIVSFLSVKEVAFTTLLSKRFQNLFTIIPNLHFSGRDMISGLPNDIICHIACFLSAKEAAFATVLSKRFQNLFTIIPSLEFDDMVKNQGSFTDFLDRVLALPASSRIRKFSLRRRKRITRTHYAHANRFIRDVLKRGVLDVELDIHVGKRCSLPFEVFTCKTVIKLELGTGFVISVLPKNAFLPALEILILNSVSFQGRRRRGFEAFLAACPVLKELTIHGFDWERWKWSGKLSSQTLQRLTTHRNDLSWSDSKRITLDMPSLTYLDFSDLVADEYRIVNLDSLVEAKLDLMLTIDHRYRGFVDDDSEIFTSNPTNLIKGLKNVEILNLSSPDTFQVFYYFREAIPVFEKLSHLTITPNDVLTCRKFLPFLVEKSPNLKTLVIDGQLHYDEEEPESVCDCMLGYNFLLSCPLKVLMITDYSGTRGEVEQLKHLVEKLPCLEEVKLWSEASSEDEEETLMLPKAPSNCKIKVYQPRA